MQITLTVTSSEPTAQHRKQGQEPMEGLQATGHKQPAVFKITPSLFLALPTFFIFLHSTWHYVT